VVSGRWTQNLRPLARVCPWCSD